MKNILIKILCLALCAFALVCSTAMAEPAFTLDADGYITAIAMDSEAEMLIIPDKVGETDVRGIRAGVFSSYTNLKYVHLEVSEFKFLADGSMDFTSAPNLECIYVNYDPHHNLFQPKIKFNDDVEILQYVDLADKIITNASITCENGVVRLVFENIIPDGYSGYNYRVIRSEQNSSASVSFDSDEDYSNFSISNGMVTFTDVSAEPGQDYYYEIVAMSPFSQTPGYETGIRIPAAETEEKPLPETGDGANIVLWIAMLAASAIGIMIVSRKAKKEY